MSTMTKDKAQEASTKRPEDENLGLGANIAYGLQHVLTMYGGIVAVPLIIGQAAGLSPSDTGVLIAAALFMGGVATLLQTLGLPFFGCQLPLVQGVSFASVSTMIAIVVSGSGLPAVFGAVMASAAIGFLIAPVFSKVIKFLPAVGDRHHHHHHRFDFDAGCRPLGHGRQQPGAGFWQHGQYRSGRLYTATGTGAQQGRRRRHFSAIDPSGSGARYAIRRLRRHGGLLRYRRGADLRPAHAVSFWGADI